MIRLRRSAEAKRNAGNVFVSDSEAAKRFKERINEVGRMNYNYIQRMHPWRRFILCIIGLIILYAAVFIILVIWSGATPPTPL